MNYSNVVSRTLNRQARKLLRSLSKQFFGNSTKYYTYDQFYSKICNSSDPIATLNQLLSGNWTLDNKDACRAIRQLFSSRGPEFSRMIESQTAVEASALDVIFDLYLREYRGETTDPDLLVAYWDKASNEFDGKIHKSEALLFLVTAIKAKNLNATNYIIDNYYPINPRELPSLCKSGILRVVAGESPQEYPKWLKRLAPNSIELLQNVDINRNMGISNIMTHDQYAKLLIEAAPDQLKAELEEDILPFFNTNQSKLHWIDCRLNIEMKSEFLEMLRHAVAANQPLSLIRLGDGESYAWQAQHPKESLEMRERVWWGTALDQSLRHEIGSRVLEAIANADVLGVPSLFRFARDTDPRLQSYAEHRSFSGLVRVLKGVNQLPASHRVFTEDRIHQVCFDLENILKLSKSAKKVVVVSSLVDDEIYRCFEPIADVVRVEIINVPTHTKTRGNEKFTELDQPLPYTYDSIDARIKECVEPGSLVIVASGVIGKIFCDTARHVGGVALDVGSMVDYWAGLKTRSIADLV